MPSGDPRCSRLPACHACYIKKIKCDSNRPKCAPCVRSDSECITLGLDGHQPVSRGYISELEQRVKALQGELQDALDDLPDPVTGKRKRRNSTRSAYSSPTFTEGAGLSFMRPLFTDPGWRAHNPTLLQNLSRSARLVEATITANALPSAETARGVFDNYLTGTNVLNPFLLRREIENVYQRVFLPGAASQPASHDLFRAFMILAIGSIHGFRRGTHEHHPYGYFLSAMHHFTAPILSRGLGSIQDLLLIGRFGIYHHIGTSIWEITQLCMRLCVEQGLHQPPTTHTSLLHEQLQRRVFWECYVIDRYSSITLDRPLAIADRDIRVLLPVNANDDEIEAAEGSVPDLDIFQVSPRSQVETTDLSVFFLCIRLRQITSKIHSLFQYKKPLSPEAAGSLSSVTAPGRIYTNLYRLLQELDDWRGSVPFLEHPRCLYESQDFYDLRWMRERLLLVRKAMDLVPRRGHLPPRDLLSLCSQYATGTITVFCRLYESQRLTYTRSYFQTLFTAGLSVVFYLSVVADSDQTTVGQAVDALSQAERVLKRMGDELPDAVQYVTVYEALYRHTLEKLRQSGRWSGFQTHGNDNAPDLSHSYDAAGIIQPLAHAQLIPTSDTRALGDWPLPTPNSLTGGGGTDLTTVDSQGNIPEEAFSFGALFWDDTMWSMEAGLGEYAYGNPPGISLWDGGSYPL
ncbi:fungal-specific transcription factor domain-containing protein [Aspergillus pseudodeflectus]|uniref:Fungal-specific transcription factor domain-containing protein n=1 Tax=Aspergillus pseudodeflectus TaxID=176178 RepID=A0ABR4KIS4_9EURO